ncbi:hypothetical protein LSAT2_029924 [Lamellibrachia satsuma]|nr:hypothetical protein LSAT2_029924 [Lamellibrachia satsuma]
MNEPVYEFRVNSIAPSYHAIAPSYHAIAPSYHAIAPSYHTIVPSYHAIPPSYDAIAPSYRVTGITLPGHHTMSTPASDVIKDAWLRKPRRLVNLDLGQSAIVYDRTSRATRRKQRHFLSKMNRCTVRVSRHTCKPWENRMNVEQMIVCMPYHNTSLIAGQPAT